MPSPLPTPWVSSDPELTVMGPIAFYILDTINQTFFVLLSIIYPTILGFLFAYLGYLMFRKKDLV